MKKIADWQTLPQRRMTIATDHGGYEMKQELLTWLAGNPGLEVIDCGPCCFDAADDYPDFAGSAAGIMSMPRVIIQTDTAPTTGIRALTVCIQIVSTMRTRSNGITITVFPQFSTIRAMSYNPFNIITT